MPDIGPFIRTDYKEVDKRDEVRNLLGWVRGDSDKRPVITDEGKPFGIVNERAITNRNIDQRAKVEGNTLVTRALPVTASLEDAISRMAEFRASYLPVADDRGKVAGYVDALDVVRDRLDGMRAADVAFPVSVLSESQTMSEAHNRFHKEYVDHLPVTDANGKLAGVISRRTLLRLESNLGAGNGGRKPAGGERIHPLQEPIRGYVDENLGTIDATASAAEALAKVEKYGYVVVKGPQDSIQGIVTAETMVRRVHGGA